jgi:ubiquinone/menaquinone biosynthesis C-methylase UbiE
MQKWHKYYIKDNKLIDGFDSMYAAESIEGFDSHQQSTLTFLYVKILLAILDRYNFKSILDYGCGKGAITHLLKKENNTVVGHDISEVAVKLASNKYKNITFKTTVSECDMSSELVLFSNVFMFLDWKKIIRKCKSKYICIVNYIPSDAFSSLNSMDEVSEYLSKTYSIVEDVRLQKAQYQLIFAEAK